MEKPDPESDAGMTIRPEDELLTIEYVAAAAGLTYRSVERLIKQGKLAVVRLSRRSTRIRRSELQAYIAQHESRSCDN